MTDKDVQAADDKKSTTVSSQEAADLSVYKTVGNDSDLPANQRRSRKGAVVDKDGMILQQGDIVDVNIANMGSMTVLGHARGVGWVLCAYKMGSLKCVGTWPVGLLVRRGQ